MARKLVWTMLHKAKRTKLKVRGFFVSLYINLMGGTCSRFIYVDKGFNFTYPPHEGIHIGKGVYFGKDVTIDVRQGSKLRIDEFTSFTQGNVISAVKEITIGSYCMVAEYSSIRDADHNFIKNDLIRFQPLNVSPVRIGNDVWIGRGVIVLKGVQIGDGVVIGANSVVNSNIPPQAIAVGSPSRVIKYRSN